MIDLAAALLSGDGMGAWVRYKLDQKLDHILIDEAQDTNRAQWTIASRLTEEFFAGEGARGLRRTVFAVGDFKQAIRSEEHTSELQSLMRISYAVFCLKKKINNQKLRQDRRTQHITPTEQ